MIDDSAMLVARITFRVPGGGRAIAACCSDASCSEWSGSSVRPAARLASPARFNALRHSWISATPGKKMRTPPPSGTSFGLET